MTIKRPMPARHKNALIAAAVLTLAATWIAAGILLTRWHNEPLHDAPRGLYLHAMPTGPIPGPPVQEQPECTP